MDRKKDLANIRVSWFQEHIATLERHGPISHLRWAKPGTSVYLVNYYIHRNTLMVTGDIGDAVFWWSQEITFEWLASLGTQYFIGKCQASETGCEFYEWDGDHMLKRVVEYTSAEAFETFKDAGGADAIHNEHEWYMWCASNIEILGTDAWEWIDAGKVEHIRALGMIEGIRMAVFELEKAAA